MKKIIFGFVMACAMALSAQSFAEMAVWAGKITGLSIGTWGTNTIFVTTDGPPSACSIFGINMTAFSSASGSYHDAESLKYVMSMLMTAFTTGKQVQLTVPDTANCLNASNIQLY